MLLFVTAAPQTGEGSQPSHVAPINICWISEKETNLRRVLKDRKSIPHGFLGPRSGFISSPWIPWQVSELYKSFPRQLAWLLGNKRALKRIAVLLG